MSRSASRRRKRSGRLRRRLQPQYIVLLLAFAGYLAFQTWTEHRLDTLRKERVEFEERIVSARAGLASANLEFARQSEQGRIVDRARRELEFVDSPIGTRTRLAMPAPDPAREDPLLWKLAAGLDRLGGIHRAFAAEERP